MPGRRRLAGCALLSVVVLAARLAPLPPLADAVTGAPVDGVSLAFPLGHAVLAPVSLLADLIACQSARASIALLAFLLTFGFAFFRFFLLEDDLARWKRPADALRALGLYSILIAAALAFGALAPRPAPRLEVKDPDELVVDFHSHTSASWDGRKSFTPERSARWHEDAGFNAGFVTDHNVFAGAANAHGLSRLEREHGGAYVALEGEELSLHGAHVVVLGNRALVDPRDYQDGLEGLKRLFREAGPKHGALTIMSLPEYNRHYWDRLGEVADWGADGFELVSASPRGLDFPREKLAKVAELCRGRGLLGVGATDNHGYGGAACVWNLVRVPGWRELDPDALQARVMETLRRERRVRVVERPRPDAPRDWTIWLHPAKAGFDLMRRLSWLHSFFTLIWIWAVWLFWGSKGIIRAHP